MTRQLRFALSALVVCSLSACTPKPTSKGGTMAQGTEPTGIDPGGSLISATDYTASPAVDSALEPIVLPTAHVVIRDKVDVASQVEGKILWVGVETNDAEIAQRKIPAGDLFTHPRDGVRYRRIIPGDIARKGQVAVILDDMQAHLEFEAAKVKQEAAETEAGCYVKTVESLDRIVKQFSEALQSRSGTLTEYLQQMATLIRYQADLSNRQGAAKVAAAEANKAKHQFEKHTIRMDLDGEVTQIVKFPGESVRPSEPIFVAQSFGRLRVEASLPQQFGTVVGKGDPVVIQVARDLPADSTFVRHTTNRSISAVAVVMRDGKPVVLSAGDDGELFAWNRDRSVVASWSLRTPIRCLAVTRVGADPFFFVGGDDGIGRLYDASTLDALPVRKLDERHDSPITAAAFSPDGKWLVTADDRRLHLWSTADGKKKYTFPGREHHSPITAVHFTPQGKVVSIAKEPSVRVWQVGEKSARVERPFDNRTGDVSVLDVSADGNHLLLDADRTVLDIIHLRDGKERQIRTSGEAARFTNFAVFSPKIDPAGNQLVAAAGGQEGVVNVYVLPSATERGSEIARLMCRDGAAATCCTFSPDHSGGFVVVGTRKGDVHVWDMPQLDWRTEIRSTVTNLQKEVDTSGRSMRMMIEVENPVRNGKPVLRAGAAVAVVIPRK